MISPDTQIPAIHTWIPVVDLFSTNPRQNIRVLSDETSGLAYHLLDRIFYPGYDASLYVDGTLRARCLGTATAVNGHANSPDHFTTQTIDRLLFHQPGSKRADQQEKIDLKTGH